MIENPEITINDFELTKLEVDRLFKSKPENTVLVWRDGNFKRYLSFVTSNWVSLQLVTREFQIDEEELLGVEPIPTGEVINCLSPERLCEQTYLDRKKIPQQSGVTYLPAITILSFIEICKNRKMSNKDITKLLPKSADLIFDAELGKKIISMINLLEDLNQREKFCTDVLNDVDNPYGYLLKLSSKKPLFGKSENEKVVSGILVNTKLEIKKRERQKQLERELELERERAATVRMQQQAPKQCQIEDAEKQRSMTSIPKPKQPQYPAAHNLAMMQKLSTGKFDDAHLDRIIATLDDYLILNGHPIEANSRSQGQQIKNNSMAVNGSRPRADSLGKPPLDPQSRSQGQQIKNSSMAVNSSRPRADSLKTPPINISIDLGIADDVGLNENNKDKSNLIQDEVKPAESKEGSLGAIVQFAKNFFSYGDENASSGQSEESESDEENLSYSP